MADVKPTVVVPSITLDATQASNLNSRLTIYSRTFGSLSALFAAIEKLAPVQGDIARLAALGQSVAMDAANDVDVDREDILVGEVPT